MLEFEGKMGITWKIAMLLFMFVANTIGTDVESYGKSQPLQSPDNKIQVGESKKQGFKSIPRRNSHKSPKIVENQILIKYSQEAFTNGKDFFKDFSILNDKTPEQILRGRKQRKDALEEKRQALFLLGDELIKILRDELQKKFGEEIERKFNNELLTIPTELEVLPKVEIISGLSLPIAGVQTLKVSPGEIPSEFRELLPRGLQPEKVVETVIKLLQRFSMVEYAVRNAKVYPLGHNSPPPNDNSWLTHKLGDPDWSKLWGLERIGMKETWTDIRESGPITIAVIDTGIYSGHPDLSQNIFLDGQNFTHLLTPPFVDNDEINQCEYPQPIDVFTDETGHGTVIAGILAANGDNQMVDDPATPGVPEDLATSLLGVNWRATLLPIKIQCIRKGNTDEEDPDIASSVSIADLGIQYAFLMGAHIINASWSLAPCEEVMEHSGTPCSSAELTEYEEMADPLLEAIENAEAAGILVVAAAGNGGTNNDVDPRYPANFPVSSLITVAASTKTDERDSGSNYSNGGLVHIAAPGDGIFSTNSPSVPLGNPWNEYVGLDNGTSTAAPFVAGCAALLQSMRLVTSSPLLTPQEIKTILMASSDRPQIGGVHRIEGVVNGARLNCHEAIHQLSVCATCGPPAPPTGLTVGP